MTRPFQSLRDQGGNKVFGIRPDLSMSYAWSAGVPQLQELSTMESGLQWFLGPYSVSGNAKLPNGEYAIAFKSSTQEYVAVNVATGTSYQLISSANYSGVFGTTYTGAWKSMAIYNNKLWVAYGSVGSGVDVAYYNIPAVGSITSSDRVAIISANTTFSSVFGFSSTPNTAYFLWSPGSVGAYYTGGPTGGVSSTGVPVILQGSNSISGIGHGVLVLSDTGYTVVDTELTTSVADRRQITEVNCFKTGLWWRKIRDSYSYFVDDSITYASTSSVATKKIYSIAGSSGYLLRMIACSDTSMLALVTNYYSYHYGFLVPDATSTLDNEYFATLWSASGTYPNPGASTSDDYVLQSYVNKTNVLSKDSSSGNVWSIVGKSANSVPNEQTPWTYDPSTNPLASIPETRQALASSISGYDPFGRMADGSPIYATGTKFYKVA